MNDQSDSQLLRAYVDRRSETAFAELVRRHVDFVYSAALRMVCDSHLAEDVTQATFMALAKSAAQLLDRPTLSGWLHRTTQNIAAQTVRTEVRRRVREQEAAAMTELPSTTPDAAWDDIAPHLDAALSDLSEPDRDAVLLRYFERKSAREMAEILGVGEEAAQKRVTRAVERLREFFAKRGVVVGTSGLVAIISANAVQAAPAGLALTISAAALAGTTLAATATATATKAIAMTTLQKALVTTVVAVLVGAGVHETLQASKVRDQNSALQQQQGKLNEQIQKLLAERDEAALQLVALREDNERLNRTTGEVLRLRGQVGRLRRDSDDLARLKAARGREEEEPLEATAKSWLAKVNLLKQQLEQMPDRKIPEMQLLKDADWLRITGGGGFQTDAEVRRALCHLRDSAKQYFAPLLGQALRKYVAANAGQLPTDATQLATYFESPADGAILQRYQMLMSGDAGKLKGHEMVVGERAPVDAEYDSLLQIGLNAQSLKGVGQISVHLQGDFGASAHYEPRLDKTGGT